MTSARSSRLEGHAGEQEGGTYEATMASPPAHIVEQGKREAIEAVKIFTLKMPTLINKKYILTRFKGEHGTYKGTGSKIYTIKKVTWRGLSDP